MENITISKATPNDIDQLQKIGRQTFYEAFSAENTGENMEKYVAEKFSAEQLTTELITFIQNSILPHSTIQQLAI